MSDTRYSILGTTPEQVEAVGGKNLQIARFSGVIFAELSEGQANQLKEMGLMVSPVTRVSTEVLAPPVVSPPVPIAALPTYTPSELVTFAGYDELRNITDPPLYGAGINAAVIGTGIRETHSQINNRVIYRKNYTTDPMHDGFDHDTGAAAMLLAVAPDCGILNLKVIGDNGEGDEENVVMAIEECIEMHENKSEFAPLVINLSLGTADDGNPNTPLRIACRTAIAVGLWVFAAAGNQGPNLGTIMSPASERYVFAVGSAKYLFDKKTFVVSDFSSRGPTLENFIKPDGVLFGEDILVASSKSDTATLAKSGTSFATPFGAGMAVVYLDGVNRKARTLVEMGQLPSAEFYFVPPDKVIDDYFPRISIKPMGVAAGKDNLYGWGLPYGPMIARALQPGAGIADMANILPMLLLVPMMGMVFRQVKYVK